MNDVVSLSIQNVIKISEFSNTTFDINFLLYESGKNQTFLNVLFQKLSNQMNMGILYFSVVWCGVKTTIDPTERRSPNDI